MENVGFQKVYRPLGIHLMCQGHDLRYVSRVFEDDHVMGIETYGSMVFSSMKQILNDVHDANVSKQIAYADI
jgi:predicted transcriptional regulator